MRASEFDTKASELRAIKIIVSVQVKEGCERKVDEGEFQEYMHVPIDSCNCVWWVVGWLLKPAKALVFPKHFDLEAGSWVF